MRLLATTVLAVLAASAAKGVELDEAAFKRVLADPVLQTAVMGAAKKTNVVVADACPNAYIKILDTVHVESVPRFAAKGHLVSGRWVSDLIYVGCGAARTLHVLVEFAEGKEPNLRALFPGSAHAGPQLQMDVFNSAGFQSYVDQLQRQRPACQKGYVDDTAFLDRESTIAPGAKEPAWREAWTIDACGKKDVVIIMYGPRSVGTKFSIVVREHTQPAHSATSS
jgi:hypothetical protein